MQKNPDSAFALEESSPLKGTYASAAPLGPIMELRAQGGQNAFTADRATQTLDYWRTTTHRLLSDPEASGSLDTLRTYSHDATAQANLLAGHNYNAEAEQAYPLLKNELKRLSGLDSDGMLRALFNYLMRNAEPPSTGIQGGAQLTWQRVFNGGYEIDRPRLVKILANLGRQSANH